MLLYMWVINMSEIKTGRGYVYSIQYHIVWCVKYRHKILTSKIEKSLIKILNKIADDNEFSITEINTDLDHIHLLFRGSPNTDISKFINAYKSASSRLLKKEYPEIREKLWKESSLCYRKDLPSVLEY